MSQESSHSLGMTGLDHHHCALAPLRKNIRILDSRCQIIPNFVSFVTSFENTRLWLIAQLPSYPRKRVRGK